MNKSGLGPVRADTGMVIDKSNRSLPFSVKIIISLV